MNEGFLLDPSTGFWAHENNGDLCFRGSARIGQSYTLPEALVQLCTNVKSPVSFAFPAIDETGNGVAATLHLHLSLSGWVVTAKNEELVLVDGEPVAEPILGWRIWNILAKPETMVHGFGPFIHPTQIPHKWRLAGLAHTGIWEPGSFSTAGCNSRSNLHPRPVRGCGCGFWLVQEDYLPRVISGYNLDVPKAMGIATAPGTTPGMLTSAISPYPIYAYGLVQGWGHCVEHTKGWRVQHAHPVSIVLVQPLPHVHDPALLEKIKADLEQAYHCEVSIGDWPSSYYDQEHYQIRASGGFITPSYSSGWTSTSTVASFTPLSTTFPSMASAAAQSAASIAATSTAISPMMVRLPTGIQLINPSTGAPINPPPTKRRRVLAINCSLLLASTALLCLSIILRIFS